MTPVRTAAAVVAVLLTVPSLTAGAVQPPPVEEWRPLLARAMYASRVQPYRGTVIILAFDGPRLRLAEVEVVHDPDAGLELRGGGWVLGHTGSDAYLVRAGEVLDLGEIPDRGFRLDDLTRKYTLRTEPPLPLDTGVATPVVVEESDGGRARERLYVDATTGLVVRRETYGPQGALERLVAFTELELGPTDIGGPSGSVRRDRGHPVALADTDLLGEGWVAPAQLPGGYQLEAVYRLPGVPDPSLHLVYGDGLYTLSLYEQQGSLDADALHGAVADELGGARVYRWPGAQPARLVWSADGVTFTLVSDAPSDHLEAVVTALPHQPTGGLLARVRRGLVRVAQWLWPFG